MSFTYDIATTVGQVRLLIDDTDAYGGKGDIGGTAGYDFSDEEIEATVTLETALGLKGAAARLLRTLSVRGSKLAVRKDRLGLTDDLTQIAKNLREEASALRAEAIEDAEAGVPLTILSPSWTRREYERNILLDNTTVTDYAQEKQAP